MVIRFHNTLACYQRFSAGHIIFVPAVFIPPLLSFFFKHPPLTSTPSPSASFLLFSFFLPFFFFLLPCPIPRNFLSTKPVELDCITHYAYANCSHNSFPLLC